MRAISGLVGLVVVATGGAAVAHDCRAFPVESAGARYDHDLALAGLLPPSVVGLPPGLLPLDLGGLAGGSSKAVCPVVPPIALPPGWRRGDTHVHVQGCSLAAAGQPGYDPLVPDVSFGTILDAMPIHDLETVSILLWGWTFLTPDEFLASYGQNVAAGLAPGKEHASTAGDPDLHLQTGMETSGFSVSMWGHQIGLGIGPAQTDIFRERAGQAPVFGDPGAAAPYSWWDTTPPVAPVAAGQYVNDGSGRVSERAFRIFKERPSAVTGWAHQVWPVGFYADCGGFAWEAVSPPLGGDLVGGFAVGRELAFPPIDVLRGTTRTPVLGPFDVALGWADFLEAFLLIESIDAAGCAGAAAPLRERWYGMYYKLLSAGQRVGLAGGSDAPCSVPFSPSCPPITVARVDPAPGGDFPYAEWLASVRDGRVSLATSSHQLLELEVHGPDGAVALPGDGLAVTTGAGAGCATSACVDVELTYHFDPAGITTSDIVLEIVVDGRDDRTLKQVFPVATTASPAVFTATVELSDSGWIAARSGYAGDPQADRTTTAHTGAVRVYADGRPLADVEAAEYWMLYADYLGYAIDELAVEAAELGDPLLFDLWVGSEDDEQEIRDHVARGRRVFRAVRDYGAGLDAHAGARLVPGIPPTFPGPATPGYPAGRTSAPIGITVDGDPLAPGGPSTITVSCFNAPRHKLAALAWGFSTLANPGALPGAELWVSLHDSSLTPYTTTGQAGFAEIPFETAPSATVVPVYVQFLVPDEVQGFYVASEVLEILLPL